MDKKYTPKKSKALPFDSTGILLYFIQEGRLGRCSGGTLRKMHRSNQCFKKPICAYWDQGKGRDCLWRPLWEGQEKDPSCLGLFLLPPGHYRPWLWDWRPRGPSRPSLVQKASAARGHHHHVQLASCLWDYLQLKTRWMHSLTRKNIWLLHHHLIPSCLRPLQPCSLMLGTWHSCLKKRKTLITVEKIQLCFPHTVCHLVSQVVVDSISVGSGICHPVGQVCDICHTVLLLVVILVVVSHIWNAIMGPLYPFFASFFYCHIQFAILFLKAL